MHDIIEYDLKNLLAELVGCCHEITEIYMFGSRAYGTGSLRSDCDILIRGSEASNIRHSDLRNFSISKCSALDFFIAEGGRARSCMNESFVRASTFEELASKLDAILLWSKNKGFTDFDTRLEAKWFFKTSSSATFVPTVLPNSHIEDFNWQTLKKRAERDGLPAQPFIGDSIDKAVDQIIDVIQRMIFRSSDLGQRGQAKSGWTVNIKDEYDCQNLFYIVAKPWLPQLSREQTEIIYDGQKKISDFTLFEGRLIIEMKHIDSEEDKRSVVKTLDGLARFYSQNANVKCLLFVVFASSSIAIDHQKWEADYTKSTTSPRVVMKVVRLT